MNMKRLLMIFAAAVGLLTACVNDELAEPAGVDKLAGIIAQEEAVLNSAEDLKALDAALSELDADLTDVKELVAHHIEYLKEDVSLEEAALATLDQQKKIAAVVGAVEGDLLSDAAYGQDLKNLFETFHTGVADWLGESFSVYYPVALANAKVAAMLADLGPQIDRQKLYVDALVSDVQSGLRHDENPEELLTLAASVENMSKMSESLASEVTSVAQEVEAEYRSAIKAICSAQSSFDAQELSELNASARTKAGEATSSLGDLASSVKACQETLADLN